MFPGNNPEPNLGLRLLYKAGEEKNAFFEVGVGKSNCKILLLIICVLTRLFVISFNCELFTKDICVK